jgi:hypothetical protein
MSQKFVVLVLCLSLAFRSTLQNGDCPCNRPSPEEREHISEVCRDRPNPKGDVNFIFPPPKKNERTSTKGQAKKKL